MSEFVFQLRVGYFLQILGIKLDSPPPSPSPTVTDICHICLVLLVKQTSGLIFSQKFQILARNREALCKIRVNIYKIWTQTDRYVGR